MESFVNQGGFDEFGCFHISDFAVGDAVIVNTEDGKVRGLVSSVSHKASAISYRTKTGDHVCHINDVCFLSESERGWLGNS